MKNKILELIEIEKSFPGVKALSGVSLELYEGEVHGLVGENGAGKSTLMHILSGVYQPEGGLIKIDGREMAFQGERDAQEAGVGMVFQERSLVDSLSVAENIFAGRQPINRIGLVDKTKMNRRASVLMNRVGLKVDPTREVGTLSPIEQQLVEISKALSLNARILIMDEPTATITEKETETLFKLIRDLKESGMSIIYISHRLQELPNICDRVSVLKDGVYQGERRVDQLDIEELIPMMVGRQVSMEYDDRDFKREEAPVVLSVKKLKSDFFEDVSFNLHEGEILGFAGLAGAGRTEIALALFGLDRSAEGTATLRGATLGLNSTSSAIRSGIGYLTENRKQSGVFLGLDVKANIESANIGRFTTRGIIDDSAVSNVCDEYVKKLGIKAPSLEQTAINLSGGNQQKLLFARWALRDTEVLIVDEPTRGVDVGAKGEIYELIRSMARSGHSIIVISSELPEVLTLCDRIMVMSLGRKVGEVLRADATEEVLMHMASGLSTPPGADR